MLDVRIKPVETLLFRGDLVAVGKFRCPSTHPLFRDSGPCSHHTIVFPRTVTRIRHEDGSTFLGNPNSVALYNQEQRYTRAKVSDVDASDWYTVSDDVLLEMMRDVDPHATPERPFRIADGPSDVPSFSVVKKGGGRAYAVYNPDKPAEFEQNDRLLFMQRRAEVEPPPEPLDGEPVEREQVLRDLEG